MLKITNMQKIVAGIAALDKLCADTERMATASDPADMKKKIEALRQHFKSQAVQVGYESKQKLANLLREVTHVLTDVIHSQNVVGEDSKAMRKLQDQIGNVTKSLSFVGEDDADGDGFRDTLDEDDLEIDLGDSKTTDQAQEAFKNAVKSIKKTDDKSSDKSSDKSDNKKPDDTKTEPVKEGKKNDKPTVKPEKVVKKAPEPEHKDSEDATEDDSEQDTNPKKFGKKKKLIPIKKAKLKKPSKDGDSEKSKDGGFVSSLLDEKSVEGDSEEATSSYIATAGMRFIYLGVKGVKKNGESFDVLRAGFGSHKTDSIKVYYYKPTKKFFNGDVQKIDRLFRKILYTVNGYSKLSSEINARVKSGHLEIVSKKEQPAAQLLGDAEGSWSYKGLGEHPQNDEKQAIWFEIGDKEFAAVPSKAFESGNVEEADSFIRMHIIGSKEHGGVGKSYNEGLSELERLVDSKKLKVIYHGGIR